MLDAGAKQQVEKSRGEVESAERVVHVPGEIGAYRPLKFCHGHRHNIGSLQHEGQCLTHVTNHNLKFGIFIEYSSQDQADDMDCRLDVPAYQSAGQFGPIHLIRWPSHLRKAQF